MDQPTPTKPGLQGMGYALGVAVYSAGGVSLWALERVADRYGLIPHWFELLVLAIAASLFWHGLWRVERNRTRDRMRLAGFFVIVSGTSILFGGAYLGPNQDTSEMQDQLQEQTIRYSSCTNSDGHNQTMIELATTGGLFSVRTAGVLPVNRDTEFKVRVGSGDPRQLCERNNIHLSSSFDDQLPIADTASGWVGVSAFSEDLTPVQGVYLFVPGDIELKDCFFEYVRDGSRTRCSDKGVVFPRP